MVGVMVPPNTGEPIEQVWMFVSRDAEGRENVCGSVIGALGSQPLITGNPATLQLFIPLARRIAEAAAKSGKTVHLVSFKQREDLEGWRG